MKIAIVIPTYNRYTKLKRCIESILKSDYDNYVIVPVFDNNDRTTFEKISQEYYKEDGSSKVHSILMPNQNYVIGIWNWFAKNSMPKSLYDSRSNFDAMMWLVDDTELYPNCLSELVKCKKENFPDPDDMDFMIGITQEYPVEGVDWRENGQCLVGRDFIQRFPDCQVCCPDYIFLYQDEEVLEYAKFINKFKLCKTAILKHYHPAFYPKEMDNTHKVSRGNGLKERDNKIYNERKKLNLIWGKSFDLIAPRGNEIK